MMWGLSSMCVRFSYLRSLLHYSCLCAMPMCCAAAQTYIYRCCLANTCAECDAAEAVVAPS